MSKRNWISVFLFVFLGFSACFLIYFRQSIFSKKNSTNQEFFLGSNNNQIINNTKILFTGDLMMDRYIREMAEQKGYEYIFEDIKSLLTNQDLVVSNLEGPVTNNASVSIGSKIGSSANYIFTFDPKVTRYLYLYNIRLVNIGNNHILNQGIEGLYETKKYLAEAGVDFFGNTGLENDNDRIKTIVINDIRIGFVNFNEFVSNAKDAAELDIKTIKPVSDFVIIFAHWGPEYETRPTVYMQNLAHEFVDKGVDLVIGTHPHVVMTDENYQGKKIYYSIGNFIMDQYFSPETKQGKIVEVKITKVNEVTYTTKEYLIKMDLSGKTSLIQ